MNGPIRLRESSSNPAARALLQAGVDERPPSSAFRNTALALGVSGSLAATTASAATGAGAAAAVTPLAAPSLTLIVGKWIALGTLGGLVMAGGASVAVELTERNPSAATPVADRLHPAPSPRGEPVLAAASASVVSQPREMSDPTPPTAAASKPTNSAKSKLETPTALPAAPASASLPNAQSLSREIAILDTARRALSSGNARAALRQLDEYSGSPRTGTLDREAQLLRIDALVLSGQRAAALALARRYLASYPNDPHAARLHELEHPR